MLQFLLTQIGKLKSAVAAINVASTFNKGDTFSFKKAGIPFRTLGNRSAIVFRYCLPKKVADDVTSFTVTIDSASATYFTGSALGNITTDSTIGNIEIMGKRTIGFTATTAIDPASDGFGLCELDATITFK